MNTIKKKILKEIESMEVIDSHEHLAPEKEAFGRKHDLFSLFQGYAHLDLRTAGMNDNELKIISDTNIPIEQRWKVFSPFWDNIRYTCYSKNILYSLEKIYGFDDINKKNYKEISFELEKNYKPGIYKRILFDTCNIKLVFNQFFQTDFGNSKQDPRFLSIMPLWLGCGSLNGSWKDFEAIENGPDLIGYFKILDFIKSWKYGTTPIKSIDDCLENQEEYLKKIKKEGAIGVKIYASKKLGSNYEPSKEEAKKTFNDFKKGKIKKLPLNNELYYYLMDRAISNAIREELVISVHTGYWFDFRELNPLNLIPILTRNPEGKFDLYHLGYPWIRESIMIGKNFPNAYINFCWLYLISQKTAKSAMDEILETIPINKIIGFGGDLNYESLENIYGHLKIAKDTIADVISDRISKGFMDFDKGIKIIKKYFYENPIELYNLKYINQ